MLAIIGLVTPASAQYGKKFSSPNYVPPTVDGTYYHGSGQLAAFIETTPANEEAWLFVHPTTGELQGSLRLDASHGAMISPNGKEILIAGVQTTNLQPVFFMGRYNATNLQLIAECQINVTSSDGYNLTAEVAPTGGFLFSGTHSPSSANVIAKYGTNLSSQWRTALTFHGAPAQLGLETYPLSGGDVGFWITYQGAGGGGILTTNVVGLLNGTNGALKWSGSYITAQVGLVMDDHRPIFGPDGSLLVSIKTVNILAPDTNTVRLARVTPTGSLAYSKTLTLTNAIHEWQYYLGGKALVYYKFQQAGAHRIQFIVLDETGNLTGNTALNCELRGSGQIKLTAARRENTDFAFARLECGFPVGSPEQTLARINLTNGAMDFRRLPTPLPGVETYEVVTTPKGDALSPHNSFRGIAAVTTAIVGKTDVAGGGGTVGFYELPSNGDFPSCLPLSASSVLVGMPLTPQLSNAVHVSLPSGITASVSAMPGTVAPLLRPTIQATTSLTQTTVCPDDGGVAPPPRPTISIIRTGPSQGQVHVPTVNGFRYGIERAIGMTNWTEVAFTNGTGGTFIHPVALTGAPTFFRASVTAQ